MWNKCRHLFHYTKCFTQQERSTFILKRRFPPRLDKMGTEFPKRLRRKNYYYDVVADTDNMKKDPMAVVLLKDVPGVGQRGEKIEMNMYAAYKKLLLPKLALYADLPEAQEIMKTKEDREYTSIHYKSVEKYLSTQAVTIMLSADTEWTLEKWHVKLALRKIDILTNEECITIPKEIKGPNPDIENKDFLIELTMNKTEKFLLRCRIYHWSSNPILNKKVMDIRSPSEPLFLDEKDKINEIIKYDQDIRRNQMLTGSKE